MLSAHSRTEMRKFVRYHSPEWDQLILDGWVTMWVYRFGVAIMTKVKTNDNLPDSSSYLQYVREVC